MKAATLILAALFAAGGITALYASLSGAKWFFSTRSAKSVTGKMSLRTARWIYGLLGAGILTMAIAIAIGA